jgi:PTH2 family peptidyl-tRNA hydrolase
MTLPLDEVKMIILVNSELEMTIGKTAAQAAHAAVYCHDRLLANIANQEFHTRGNIEYIDRDWMKIRKDWDDNGTKKIIIGIPTELELREYMLSSSKWDDVNKMPPIVCEVEDLGLTEVPRNSLTCIGIGPDYASLLDPFTGNLKTL